MVVRDALKYKLETSELLLAFMLSQTKTPLDKNWLALEDWSNTTSL
jgi:hypothetical protein